MYSLLDTSLPERHWQIEQSTKKTTKMFKGLKGKISKERSKDLKTSSSEQEHSLVGQDIRLYVSERCKHQAEKPAWGAIRRKNGMKLRKKKTWDENLLALLGCRVNLEGRSKRASAREPDETGQIRNKYTARIIAHRPGVGLGTSISDCWHLLLLFFYILLQNPFVDFQISTL